MTAHLRRLGRAIERWYFDDTPLEPLAACRIALGLSLLSYYLIAAPTHAELWGPDGIIRYAFDPDTPHLLQRAEPLLLWGALLGAVGIALGLATRAACLVFLVAHLGHTVQTPHFTWGWAMVTPVFVAYLLVSDSHRIWSLDALIHCRRHPDAPRPTHATAWPLRLFQLNAIAIYVAAAWHRIDDGAWLRGEMVFEALAATVFTRAPGLDVHLIPYKGALEVLCWYTWIVELAGPIFLWFRRTRRWMALLLMTVHLGLELTALVGAWQLMMLSVLLTFLPPRWLRRVFGWPARLARRPDDPTPGAPRIAGSGSVT